jgi:hypothetical protein
MRYEVTSRESQLSKNQICILRPCEKAESRIEQIIKKQKIRYRSSLSILDFRLRIVAKLSKIEIYANTEDPLFPKTRTFTGAKWRFSLNRSIIECFSMYEIIDPRKNMSNEMFENVRYLLIM